MVNKGLSILLLAALLSGCGPSYEAEWKAAQEEIMRLQAELAEAQRKLKAADNEVRHKIFTLARRANSFLQATTLDTPEINRLQQELAVHLDSYSQLNGAPDQVTLVARFYSDKLATILMLQRDALRAYDRQYNSCLSDLDGAGKKNDLSTMLCEVQADVARKEPNAKLLASKTALVDIGKELLSRERLDGIASMTAEELEERFQLRLNEIIKSAG